MRRCPIKFQVWSLMLFLGITTKELKKKKSTAKFILVHLGNMTNSPSLRPGGLSRLKSCRFLCTPCQTVLRQVRFQEKPCLPPLPSHQLRKLQQRQTWSLNWHFHFYGGIMLRWNGMQGWLEYGIASCQWCHKPRMNGGPLVLRIASTTK